MIGNFFLKNTISDKSFFCWGIISVLSRFLVSLLIVKCNSGLCRQTVYMHFPTTVAQKVQPMGSPVIHRIRLYDELEQVK